MYIFVYFSTVKGKKKKMLPEFIVNFLVLYRKKLLNIKMDGFIEK